MSHGDFDQDFFDDVQSAKHALWAVDDTFNSAYEENDKAYDRGLAALREKHGITNPYLVPLDMAPEKRLAYRNDCDLLGEEKRAANAAVTAKSEAAIVAFLRSFINSEVPEAWRPVAHEIVDMTGERYSSEVITVLVALPATREMLDSLARRLNWCETWLEMVAKAHELGIIGRLNAQYEIEVG
jgi:hypothetical protein